MSQDPSASGPARRPLHPNFWMTTIGGVVVGVLAVIIVLLLARRLGNDDAQPAAAPRPTSEAPADEPPVQP